MEHRIHVIVGHYGSGKTEFAINYAHKLKESFKCVYIVDLDIVNPYFRTVDAKKVLEEAGIQLIASPYAATNVDVPSLPADVYRVFADKDAAVVFDVGGDDDGAIALGRYKQYFSEEEPEVLFVVNAFRPLSSTVEDVEILLRDVEAASRLSVSALVNNANIASLTTVEELLKGQELVEQVAMQTGIACRYIAGMSEVLVQLPDRYNEFLFPIKRYMTLPF